MDTTNTQAVHQLLTNDQIKAACPHNTLGVYADADWVIGAKYARSVYEPKCTTLASENARMRAALEALVRAHEWAIANPDSPVSAGITYGHIAVDARALLSKHSKEVTG